MMHINLSFEMENYLQSKVVTGVYGSVSEVVRDAICRMRKENENLEALRAAVQIGGAQLERGEGVAYTPERLAGITDRAFANMSSGKPVSADVRP